MTRIIKNKRWLIAIAAIAAPLCLGTVHAWSTFKKPIMASHNWTETQTQLTYMIAMFVLGIATILGGSLIDKKGPKFTLTWGGIIFSMGTLMSGLAIKINSLWLLYLGYGVCGGIGMGLGYIAPIATLIRWFPDKRGLVTGLAIMGFGFGPFILGLIAPKMIIVQGVANTFFILSIVFLIIITIAAQWHIDPPKEWSPKIPTKKPELEISTKSLTFYEAIKWPQWWLLWLMLFLELAAGLGLVSQLSPFAQDVIKAANPLTTDSMLAITGGSVLSVVMIFNAFGRVTWSWLSDIIKRKNIFIIIFLTQAIFYLYLPKINSVILFTIITSYLLACFGGILAITPALAADYFGTKHIGKIYGMLLTAVTCGGFIGPFIFAKMKLFSLSIAGGMLVVAFILALFCKKPKY
jgi:MFS transporter, OFA family, oxalate/formate antiporter